MSSRSLAFTSRGAKASRAKASEASKDAIGLMGIRIHELMQAVNEGGLEKDAELQCSIRELQRVLGSVNPLLSKVQRKIAGDKTGLTAGGNSSEASVTAATEWVPLGPSNTVGEEIVLVPDQEKTMPVLVPVQGISSSDRQTDGVMNRTSAPSKEPENSGQIHEDQQVADTTDREGQVSMLWDAGPPHGIGQYAGSVDGNKPHGQGVMDWPSGKTFRGRWNHGKRDGLGWQRWTDGRTFEGEWRDGKPHGMGKWTSPGGESYEGELVMGKKSGKGIFTYADGKTYSGEWLDGKRHGQGTRLYPDGSVYVGAWKDDMRHGQGMYTWNDGREWLGEWSDGNPIKKGSRHPDHIARGSSDLEIARTESDNHSSTELTAAGDRCSQRSSGSKPSIGTRHSSPNGFPPTVPESRRNKHKPTTTSTVRKKSAAAAAERLHKASALKTDAVGVSSGLDEDWIERQWTASTLAGTMTDSEWAALSDEPNANANNNGNTSNNGNTNNNNNNNNGSTSACSTSDSSCYSRKYETGNTGGKPKGLFGGAAELLGQWGSVRVLGSVGRRRSERSVSRERTTRTDAATPEKPWGHNACDGGSLQSNRSGRSLARKDRAQTDNLNISPSTASGSGRSRANTNESGKRADEEGSSRPVPAASLARIISPSAGPAMYPRPCKGDSSHPSNLPPVPTPAPNREPENTRDSKGGDSVDAAGTATCLKEHGHEVLAPLQRDQTQQGEDGQVSSRGGITSEHSINSALLEQRRTRPNERAIGMQLPHPRNTSGTSSSGSRRDRSEGGSSRNSREVKLERPERSQYRSSRDQRDPSRSVTEHGRLEKSLERGGSVHMGQSQPATSRRHSSSRRGSSREPQAERSTQAVEGDGSTTRDREGGHPPSVPRSQRSRQGNVEGDRGQQVEGSRGHLAKGNVEDTATPSEGKEEVLRSRDSHGRREGGGSRRLAESSRARSKSRGQRSLPTDTVKIEQDDYDGRPPVGEKTSPCFSRRLRDGSSGEDGGTANVLGVEYKPSSSARVVSEDGCTGPAKGDGRSQRRSSRRLEEVARRSSRERSVGHAPESSTGLPSGGGSSGHVHGRGPAMQAEHESDVVSMSYDTGLPHRLGDYTGEVKNGLPHGQGRITWPGGKSFTGNWKNGKWTGHGTFLWGDGRRQAGEWKDNNAHGQGTFVYQDGSTYVGNFRDGLKHGHGVRTYIKGGKYDGDWQYGLRHGKGVWTAPDGDVYEGEYVDDKKNGQGTYTWADGRKHAGSWQDGKQHGQGILYGADGKISLQGKWKLGEKTLFF